MNTQKIILKDGSVICPADWYHVVPEGVDEASCSYAGVIEVRNSHLHGIGGNPIPHFIFPCPYKSARLFTEDFEEAVRAACRKVYPDFIRLEKLEPSRKAFMNVNWNDPYEVERVSELTSKLPQIGFFSIAEEGDDPSWGSAEEAPYGVVIRRDKTVAKKGGFTTEAYDQK